MSIFDSESELTLQKEDYITRKFGTVQYNIQLYIILYNTEFSYKFTIAILINFSYKSCKLKLTTKWSYETYLS